MGYYIETPQPRNKALWLVNQENATLLYETPSWPPPSDKTIICVKENGPFDAAAIIFSERELDAFADPYDHRVTHWLHMDTDRVLKHNPTVEKVLA